MRKLATRDMAFEMKCSARCIPNLMFKDLLPAHVLIYLLKVFKNTT